MKNDLLSIIEKLKDILEKQGNININSLKIECDYLINDTKITLIQSMWIKEKK